MIFPIFKPVTCFKQRNFFEMTRAALHFSRHCLFQVVQETFEKNLQHHLMVPDRSRRMLLLLSPGDSRFECTKGNTYGYGDRSNNARQGKLEEFSTDEKISRSVVFAGGPRENVNFQIMASAPYGNPTSFSTILSLTTSPGWFTPSTNFCVVSGCPPQYLHPIFARH